MDEETSERQQRDELLKSLQPDGPDGPVDAAQRLATAAHCGQVDKIGLPYIDHPMRVADRVQQGGGAPHAVAAAWLHDVLEDTWVAAGQLRSAGFPRDVVASVQALSRRPGETAESYAARIAADPVAVVVKRADLAENTDPVRMAMLDEGTRAQLKAKYAEFSTLLDEAVARQKARPVPPNESGACFLGV